jgi:4-pyridoxolactonase
MMVILIRKIYMLDGGTLELDKSFLTWKVNIGTKVTIPVWATYIETDEGKILVDTGFHREHALKFYAWENPQQSEAQRIDNQLKAIGVAPKDIDIVVHTHLHFDHCGYDCLFPNATFITQKEELRHAWVPDPFEKIGYCRPDFDVPELKWELINDEREILKGVTVVKTPGHAIGHQTVFVESKEMGVMILENDALFTQENLQKHIVGGLHFSAEDMYNSMLKLERLAKEHKAKIMFSHDGEFFKTMKLAPKYYS